MESFLSFAITLLMAPLFPGIILKVKAFFAGKKGPPLLIKYYTLIKLCKKGAVYSTSTGFLFRLGPIVSLAAAVFALLFFPVGGTEPLFSFQGDAIVLFYVLALGRFFMVLAALDTASPFEGMGAAREVFFSFLAEGTLFAILIFFYTMTGSLSFTDYFLGKEPVSFSSPAGSLLPLIVAALFMVLLTENSRVPVDDPATHLELTMIHEVMILDHSGPDLAIIELGVFYKLFFYAAFLAQLFMPAKLVGGLVNGLTFFLILVAVYIVIGVTESVTARLKMTMVPKFILTSFALVFFAAIFALELQR